MAFHFQCTCGLVLSADESQQGRRTQCPQCGLMLAIPFVQQPAYPAAAAPVYPTAPGYPATPEYPQQPTYPGGQPFAPPAAYPPATLGFPQPAAQPSFQPPVPNVAPAPTAPFVNTNPTANAAPEVPSFRFMGSGPQVADNPFQRDELNPDNPQVPGDWSTDEAMALETIWHIPCPKGHILETPNEMLDQEVLCPYCEVQFTLKHSKSIEAIEKREREQAALDNIRGEMWLRWSIGIAVVLLIGMITLIAIFKS